jgi:RNA polymerase sigma-70 factor (sigma-E family)
VQQAAPRDDERPADLVDVVPVGGGRPGDLDAEFTAFMAEHADTLLHTAWLLVGNMDRAEELTQQALVRTYGAWRRARTDPLPYARRVLVNLRVDTWRRHRREVLTDEVPEAGADARGNARAEDRDQLTRALALLTPRQRRVVVLRYLADVSEADVAADLGVTAGTIKTTASRGLATLRAALRTSDEPTRGAR